MKNKKGSVMTGGLIILIVGVVLACLLVTLIVFLSYLNNIKECENYPELEGVCSITARECSDDCNKINQIYFKHHYSSGMFSATIEECFCIKNGEVKRIW